MSKAVDVEVNDRGFIGLGEKKEEKKEEEAVVTEIEKLHIEEAEQKKHGLFDNLHRSTSNSSSSSDEVEEREEGENKEGKKGLKEKVKEKLHGEEKETELKQEAVAAVMIQDEDTAIVVEKVEATLEVPEPEEAEKKGFLDKIKEKMQKKPAEEGAATVTVVTPPPPATAVTVDVGENHDGEKKGFLEKIKEKLPGYHKNSGKEGEKSPASH